MTWEDIFKVERNKDYYGNLKEFLIDEEKNKTILPKKADRLNAFKLTPFDDVKVVILGQDPYHNINQAHGLAFSVLNDDYPPSLINIFKELVDDLQVPYPKTGNLTKWAQAGVLLLNTILTVELHKPLSHKNRGWENLIIAVIKNLNTKNHPIVYILWGANARSYKQYIDLTKHLVLESPHPSPLSAHYGFFGSRPFSKANQFLAANNLEMVDFSL